jgi:lysozyme family protein
MAREYFDPSLRKTLVHEGGYVNHPSDPGGPTNFGITLATYRASVKPDATAADIQAMPLAHAKSIYRQKYAAPIRFDDLPAGVDYAVFDYAVNSGVGRAGKVLRRVLRMPDNTSAITSEVIERARAIDSRQLVAAICDERIAFLKSLRTWPTFGAGWGRRVADVRRGAAAFIAQEAARQSQPASEPQPEPPVAPTPGKGEVPDDKASKNVVKGGAGTAGGVGGYSWWDWVCAHPIETAAIVVAGLMVVAGVIYAINRLRAIKQDAPVAGWQAPELQAA